MVNALVGLYTHCPLYIYNTSTSCKSSLTIVDGHGINEAAKKATCTFMLSKNSPFDFFHVKSLKTLKMITEPEWTM